MKKYKRTFRFFTIVDFDKEEDYLREMANKGYHFISVIFPGFYKFEVGEAKDVVYKLDFLGEKYKRDHAYHKLIEDEGWEYVTEFVDFTYYRKEAKEENTELFSDPESKLDLIKSIIKVRALPMIIVFFLYAGMFLTMELNSDFKRSIFTLIFSVTILYGFLSLYLIHGFFRLKDKYLK